MNRNKIKPLLPTPATFTYSCHFYLLLHRNKIKPPLNRNKINHFHRLLPRRGSQGRSRAPPFCYHIIILVVGLWFRAPPFGLIFVVVWSRAPPSCNYVVIILLLLYYKLLFVCCYFVLLYTYIYIYIYIYSFIYLYIHLSICIYIYIYICTH